MRKLKQKNKGITLIALVVTIVVLLILAGITIGSLTGDNSIIKEAKKAKDSAEMKALEEQIEEAIIIAEQKYRNPTLENVIEEIKKVEHVTDVSKEGDIINDLGDSIKGKLKDYLGSESTEGEQEGEDKPQEPSFDPSTLKLGEALNIEKYGWRVLDYRVQNENMQSDVWRLFYQDQNYTYLITDKSVEGYNVSMYYPNYTEVGSIGINLNEGVNYLLKNQNEWESVKATAWLTDISEGSPWNEYKNEDALFAIRRSNNRFICCFL